jgi:hypothetical protein
MQKGRPDLTTKEPHMDFAELTSQMASHAEAIRTLVSGVSEEQARWKPDPQTWSILEVIHHLYDEERQDFRLRLEVILFKPDQPWPPIDPQGWVTQRAYNQQDPAKILQGFVDERQKSLAWLNSLQAPDWAAEATAPWGKPITAGDMFAAWVAHDVLHLRQLVELHYAWIAHAAQPYQLDYAGEW